MVNIIGAGLAGTEAAYFLAEKGIKVNLYEMRPKKMTPAHKGGSFAELVCSNSLRSNSFDTAVGLLKEEMRVLNSLIIEAAEYAQIPAGSSLAVDRLMFSSYIENKIKNHPNIKIYTEEVKNINLDKLTIVAAGPLVSNELYQSILNLFDNKGLNFFDAIAPIIEFESINMDICYFKSRYDKGTADYINCPMTKDEYLKFHHEVVNAKLAPLKDFEENVFEGCLPIEVMAKRGVDTLLFGPLKPVGLQKDEKHKPYAVLQLRQDDINKTMYNVVGFQTRLAWGEQKRILQMIKGLENINILRYGVMHKNSYLDSPNILNHHFQSIKYPNLFFAGQISGVEGYVESAASGLNVGIQIYQLINNKKMIKLPEETMIGSLARYISSPNNNFVPMNANYGIIKELDIKHRKRDRKNLYFKRSIENIKKYKEKFL